MTPAAASVEATTSASTLVLNDVCGAPLKLDLSIAGMESFALHSDNRRFAFGVNEGSKTELWVLQHLVVPQKATR